MFPGWPEDLIFVGFLNSTLLRQIQMCRYLPSSPDGRDNHRRFLRLADFYSMTKTLQFNHTNHRVVSGLCLKDASYRIIFYFQ